MRCSRVQLRKDIVSGAVKCDYLEELMAKDLTVGRPQSVLWKFCLPLFGSMLFQQMYNIADSLIAGKVLGEHALAAVGNSYEVTLVFIAFAFGCNIGCSVIVSQLFGARDMARMKTAVITSLLAGCVVCVALMLPGQLLCEQLLELINTPTQLLHDSAAYLYIYIWGFPFVFFYNIATGIFAAWGDAKTPFIFLAISSVANVAADLVFVKLWNFGVDGLAWATFICQGLSCLLALPLVLYRLHQLTYHTPAKLFSFSILKNIGIVAVPSILQQSFISVGNIVIQSVINEFGPGVMAGYCAAIKLNNLVITSFTTLGNGISNYTGQNIGARKLPRVKEGFGAGIKLVWLLTLPILVIYFLCGQPLVYLFLDNPSEDALQAGVIFLRIVAPFYFVISAKLVADGVLRGAGQMKQFMTATFVDLLIRVLLAWLLAKTALGAVGIWCAWPVGWSVAAVISVMFYRRGRWCRADAAPFDAKPAAGSDGND